MKKKKVIIRKAIKLLNKKNVNLVLASWISTHTHACKSIVIEQQVPFAIKSYSGMNLNFNIIRKLIICYLRGKQLK